MFMSKHNTKLLRNVVYKREKGSLNFVQELGAVKPTKVICVLVFQFLTFQCLVVQGHGRHKSWQSHALLRTRPLLEPLSGKTGLCISHRLFRDIT